MTYRPYCGIGSRQTPPEVLDQMRAIATTLANAGYTLRHGGAAGADDAFSRGAYDVFGQIELYLPWPGFGGRNAGQSSSVTVSPHPTVEALNLSSRHHPNWLHLGNSARLLHGRNAQIVLGQNLDQPAEFVVCWTPGGLVTGGTGQALRIAEAHSIPIYNLALPVCEQALHEYLSEHPVATQNTTPESSAISGKMPPASL